VGDFPFLCLLGGIYVCLSACAAMEPRSIHRSISPLHSANPNSLSLSLARARDGRRERERERQRQRQRVLWCKMQTLISLSPWMENPNLTLLVDGNPNLTLSMDGNPNHSNNGWKP
jgi:hypothetical protein